MPRFLKNVSGRTIIIGDLNMTWGKDKVYDIDIFDKVKLIQAQDILRNNVDCGWLLPVDGDGKPLTSYDVNVVKQKVGDVCDKSVEYASGVSDDDSDVSELLDKVEAKYKGKYELNRIGEKVLFNFDTLKRLLLTPHTDLLILLNKMDWEEQDLEGLYLIYKHHANAKVKAKIRKIFKRLDVEKSWLK